MTFNLSSSVLLTFGLRRLLSFHAILLAVLWERQFSSYTPEDGAARAWKKNTPQDLLLPAVSVIRPLSPLLSIQ